MCIRFFAAYNYLSQYKGAIHIASTNVMTMIAMVQIILYL